MLCLGHLVFFEDMLFNNSGSKKIFLFPFLHRSLILGRRDLRRKFHLELNATEPITIIIIIITGILRPLILYAITKNWLLLPIILLLWYGFFKLLMKYINVTYFVCPCGYSETSFQTKFFHSSAFYPADLEDESCLNLFLSWEKFISLSIVFEKLLHIIV